MAGRVRLAANMRVILVEDGNETDTEIYCDSECSYLQVFYAVTYDRSAS